MKGKGILVVLLLMSAAGTYAQTGDSVSLREVEVTAEAMTNRVTSAVPVQTVGKRQMEQLGIATLADAVKRMAGAEVRDYGGIGGMKTVSLRHLGAAHTAVSYDGVVVSGIQAGQIDIGRFSLDNVSKLSVTIGQGLDIMQSARQYAAAGLLAIQTEQPSLGQKPWALRTGVRCGSFGMVSPSVRYWQKAGPETVFGFNGTYVHADGTYPFRLENGRVTTREKRSNSDIDSWQGEISLLHTPANGGTWCAKAGYYYSERGLPGAVILYNNESDERLWDENFYVQTTYQRRLHGPWQLSARMKYDYYRNRYIDTDVKYESGRQIDNDYQNEYYVSATLGWTPVAHLKMALAQDLSINTLRNNISNAYSETPNPTRFTSLTALSARYQRGRIQIDGNLLYTFATEHVHLSVKPVDRRRLSPSLALSCQLLPDEPLYARMMVKGTYRLPTFNDLYYIRLGNTSLRPEHATACNLGMTWSHRSSSMQLQMTVDGYYNAVTDKIVAFPSTYVWRMANFGKVHITGVDATVSAVVPIALRYALELNGAYTWQHAVDKTGPKSYSYDMQLPYTPAHSGSYAMILKMPWADFGYRATLCGERYSMVQNTYEYRLKPYGEHTVTLSKTIAVRGASIRLSASIINLTDEQYDIIQYYPMPGRSWQVTANIEL